MKKIIAAALIFCCLLAFVSCSSARKIPSFDDFTYENRGSEAYIIIGGNYYEVKNPSTPPIS